MNIHVTRDGQNFGPYKVEDINGYLKLGSLLPTDMAWHEGLPGWIPLFRIPGVQVSVKDSPSQSVDQPRPVVSIESARRTVPPSMVKTTRTKASWLLLITAAAMLSIGIALLVRFYNAPPRYTATVLGDFGLSSNGVSSLANGINASGQVAGLAMYQFNNRLKSEQNVAVRWTGNAPEKLGDIPVPEDSTLSPRFKSAPFVSYGIEINDSGDVSGYIDSQVGVDGKGYISRWPTPWRAIRWKGLTPNDVGLIGNFTRDTTSNASGQRVEQHDGVAVRRVRTTTEYLDGLGGKEICGHAINASGQIAGEASLRGDKITHAVRWSGTTAVDLGTLGGDSYGYAINISGDVVGMSETEAGESARIKNKVAFLYTNGKMYDLEALLPRGSGISELKTFHFQLGGWLRGNSINDRGQIAASGLFHGHRHALRLDPIGMSRSTRLLFLIGGIALSVVVFLFLLIRKSGGLQQASAAFRNKSSSRAT